MQTERRSGWAEQLQLLVSLALKDLWHDRKISLCVAASLVAVVAPLLLLFGLKHGVVSQLQQQLLQDPRNLEVRMTSSASYTAQWLNTVRSRPEVGFVAGLTRSLNTQVDLQGEGGRFANSTELIPTAVGDPVLNASALPVPVALGDVVLSAQAAQRLQAKVGDRIRLQAQRRFQGVEERGRWPVHVVAVLAPAQFERMAVFVHPDLLVQTEQFRDGYAIAASGLSSGLTPPPTDVRYARARIYAKSIDDVAALEQWLNDDRIETSSQLADIQNVKAINHVLGVIFAVIGIAAVTGCAASMAGAFLANVDRKRRSLAVLRLMGFGKRAVALQLVIQALILSVGGFVVGLLLYGAGSVLFNQLLGSASASQGFVCQITVGHAGLALLLAMCLAVLVSSIGAWRANFIHPAESLREI